MRKLRFFFTTVVLSTSVIVGYQAYKNATMTEQERLTLANIEALSVDEVYSFEIECPIEQDSFCTGAVIEGDQSYVIAYVDQTNYIGIVDENGNLINSK
ncbi:MAG: hypothetical protein R3Y26_07535 [Rikenellaceae bacterium]